jgi:hypothetical protein
MMRVRSIVRGSALAGLLALAAGLCGCQSSPPGDQPSEEAVAQDGQVGNVQVTDITVGRALAPDGTIAEGNRINLFWTTDTFYVSVAAEGQEPNARLKARWKFQDGTVVDENTKTVAINGPTVVAFESKKADRWEPGDYKVEILVNDVLAGSKELNAR